MIIFIKVKGLEDKKVSFCRQCGKQLEEGAKFCPDCGAPTEESFHDAPVRERIIVERRAVSGATYNEIAFAGGIYHSRLSRIFLYFATLVCIVCNAVMIVAVGPGFEMVKAESSIGGGLFAFLMLLSTGGPIIIYGLLYALTHIKKAFGKIGEETDLCALYKMQKFQISLIPVLIFGFAMIVAGLFVNAAKLNGAFGGVRYAFTEPELVDLVLGPDTSFKFVFGIVLIIVYAVFVFALVYSTRKTRIYWRYFKGKIAPDVKITGTGGRKKLIRKNPCLSETLGTHYLAAIKPYVAVRRRKSEGYAVNAEPNYVKYAVLSIIKPVTACVVALVLLIVYLAIVPAHLKQPTRLGKAASIRLGSSHETVEKLLGEPSANSSQDVYYYLLDNVDIDDIENWDDVENAFESDFKSCLITVYFEKNKYEQYAATSIEYDTDYMSLTDSFSVKNILKKVEVKSSYLYPEIKPVVVLYKNGSMKIEWGK